MNPRFTKLAQTIRTAFGNTFGTVISKTANGVKATSQQTIRGVSGARKLLLTTAVLGAAGYVAWTHPPVHNVARGDVVIRTNQLTGGFDEFREGSMLLLPGVHDVRTFSLRDQIYQPTESSKANGSAPFQSVEGMSLGVDLTVRYALEGSKLGALSKSLPDDIAGEIVRPAVQGVIYKVFTRYTVREIFSSKRAEIQQIIETELKPKLAADGIVLRTVQIGKIDLPEDYRRGMDKLLSAELETEKMRYTLALKEKRVKETELDAQAEKVRRETNAEAAGNEQVIAAKAQAEAMKHVIPFKQKQIEQRQLEAEADKQSRIRTAEGSAQARRIEASGEADSRQKLADAEAYRIDKVGKINSEQMAREGVLITKHPLLIQKTMADKLSDKITVIIAPPSTSGGFIAAGLLGSAPKSKLDSTTAQANSSSNEEDNSEGAK
jgi:regulator of protease activity HflC (stomatin/prohibitin superfamily)